MSKPLIHAESSVRKFGGKVEDYLEIHDFMDSSKAVFPDNRHRALTHNSWFIFVVEKCFGHYIEVEGKKDCENCVFESPKYKEEQHFWDSVCPLCGGWGGNPNKRRRKVSVRDICEQHILEDFGNKFIPTPGDYLEGMEMQDWMNNGIRGVPTSHRKIEAKETRKKTTLRRTTYLID